MLLINKLQLHFLFIAFFSVASCCLACSIADLSGDCAVGIDDLAILADQWLDPAGCLGHTDNCADFVGNDGVTLADLAVMAADWGVKDAIPVVINEIHYKPDLEYELVEFVELYNAGDEIVDLSGWYFSKGVSYTFPPDTTIAAGGYIVITEDETTRTISPTTSVHDKYGTDTDLIYGSFVGSLSSEGEKIELRTANGIEVDQVDYQLGFPWPTVGDEVPEGAYGNGHSIQLINPDLDNDLAGSWRSAYPTPGAANTAVYAENIPPQIRQVNHSPNQPMAGEIVTITAKVTDSDGVSSVILHYQLVEPGNYIPLRFPDNTTNADYENPSNWNELVMYDDGPAGGHGDEYAGDFIYTVQMPVSLQIHRNLVRYRITVEDAMAMSVTVPYSDDPQPNFAYFVYNGVPDWTGANQPGVTTSVTYGPEVMHALPVYHLISRQTDVEGATWYSKYTGSDYLWYGTMVYDGHIYDHIRYRARGGVWRYAMGKNMWKFDFNRGHYFQARDNYGKKYDTAWDKLNFSACIQQGDYQHRGEQGMFEAAGFKLFNMMGVEAPKTHWLQFRVIDKADENGSDQFTSDLWGLYLAIEQMDGRYLQEHQLEDGNLYKIENYSADSNNQGPLQPINGSDYTAFRSAWYYPSTKPTELWWRQNVDLDRYYSYRCVVEGIHHGDIAYGKNYFFYNNPTTSIWTMYPWDLDLTWANNMYGDGEEPFKNTSHGAIFNSSEITVEYENRLREFHDLLYNSDQLYVLLDELAAIIDPPDQDISIADVDRAMWDYNPVMSDSSIVNLSKAGQGRFYQKADTKDFPGMVQIMKDYVTGYRAFDTYSEDLLAPATPQISYLGDPNYPENDLRFQTSVFSDPQGEETFAAMKWRIAQVGPYAVPSSGSGTVRLIDSESDWLYFEGYSEPSEPISAYRLAGFDDSSWNIGQGPIGYGESLINEILDMRDNYTTIYLRKTFEVSDPADFDTLSVKVLYDDGYNLWINGNHVASGNVSDSELAYNATANSATEPGDYVSTTVNASDCLVSGINVIAVQVLNASLNGSSDCVIDVILDADLVSQSSEYQFVYTGKPGKYEIDAVWESDELTTYAGEIQIPADGIKPGSTYRVRCKMKDDTGRWSHWSDPVQFVAGEAIDADILSYLRLTELMYNNGDADFIELKNISSDITLDLSNVSITSGVQFNFADSNVVSLAPEEVVLVVKDLAEFRAQYGTGLDSKIAGVFVDSSLSNSGETIKIEDIWNGTIIEFTYNDARGWPLAADGTGHSLIPLPLTIEDQPLGTLDFGGNWRQSTYIGGSPGTDDPISTKGIVINELMAHTDYLVPPHESNDWIELYNSGTSTVNLNGDWYLSDDSDDLKKYSLPSSSLTSGSYISYDQVNHFNPDGTGPSGWGLNKAGDTIFLSYLPGTNADRVVDCIQFEGQENSISLSRYPDGGDYWFSTSPETPDTANNNLLSHVVISEIMYHPQEDTETQTYDEYIEIYNPTGFLVNMWTVTGNWAIDGGVNYEFPASTTLASGERILVVDFDPAVETARLDAFEAAYGTGELTVGVDVFGPWSGDLSNNGERITLEKSQDSDDLDDPSAISWIIIDECIYNDYWPWPTEPDGTGLSLRRLSAVASASGNDADNWTAQIPTPGW